MSATARAAISDVAERVMVSSVTAFEFSDLGLRGRLGQVPDFSLLLDRIEAEVVPFPAEAWRVASALPHLHGDPVDRMLIAHAIHADLTLVTADETMRRYPVRSLW